MFLDYETTQQVKRLIRKQIDKIKEDIVYSIDTIEKLSYAKGQISALEALLQDLKDLQNTEEDVRDDTDNKGKDNF